ncbi:MAG: hypothetical protein ABS54_17690 [Hyphomicrobium sp. SCN 65-11]|nr:MAG: hypothetical protein ABS54_17690 [Hyphomicrobium sp. SCN 65-11]
MNKAVLIAAALVLVPLTVSSQEAAPKDPGASVPGRSAAPSNPAGEQSQSPLRDSVTRAVDTVMDACDDDIAEFCEGASSGRGRLALCMMANEDQLSRGCRSALIRVTRELRRNVDRVAEGCLNEIRTLCGDAGKVGQCLQQKRGSLSSSCQTIVGSLAQRMPRLIALRGLPVISSDNKNLGQVVEVNRDPDGKIQSIQVDVGRALGIGTKLVTITADKLDRAPGLKIFMSESEVRALPETKGQQ